MWHHLINNDINSLRSKTMTLLLKTIINVTIFTLVFSLLLISSSQPKSDTELYESAVKWRGQPYPDYHPGDVFAYSVMWIYGKVFISGLWNECEKLCKKKFNCIPMAKDYIESYLEFNQCRSYCKVVRIIEEKYSEKSIAKHIEGGKYSDESYYSGVAPNLFNNIHPAADKYKKTKWQTVRDECMNLASQNPKFDTIREVYPSGLSVSFDVYKVVDPQYYQNCLKERGYLLGDKKEQ